MDSSFVGQDWAHHNHHHIQRARAHSNARTCGSSNRESFSTNPRESLSINTNNPRESFRSSSPPSKSPSTPSQSYRSHHGGTRVPSSLNPQKSSEETLKQPQTPVSSFLMEKLRQERMAEGEKLASSLSGGSLELPASPARAVSPADNNNNNSKRPRSSENGGDLQPQQQQQQPPSKKKGLGLKEMEQIMSKMHKQNFDLKLELFHRREKQTVLEQKIEQLAADKDLLESQNRDLEAENTKQTALNATLTQEVDKRDMAVQEAVSMIVNLESEKDALAKELAILRELLAGNFLNAAEMDLTSSNTPRNGSEDNLGKRTVTKMPSFVSHASQQQQQQQQHTTEHHHLRNVWIKSSHSKSPLPSMRAVSGFSRIEAEPLAGLPSEVDHNNRLASPSLSDLSESSFQSVYGQKHPDAIDLKYYYGAGDDDGQYLMGEDSTMAPSSLRVVLETPKPRIVTPISRLAKYQYADEQDSSTTTTATTQRKNQFTSITDIIASSDSSSSRDGASKIMTTKVASSHAQSSHHLPSNVGSTPTTATRYTSRPRDDKRDALRRVVVVGTRLPHDHDHDHGLPPTPDTISTTTLSGFKHSDDVLMAARAQQQSLLVTSDGMGGVGLSPSRRGSIPITPLIITTHDGSGASIDDNNISSTPRRRRPPRSASGTSLSQDARASFEEEDTAVSDAHSLESSLDIWLRESSKSADRRGYSPPFMSSVDDADLYNSSHRLSASSGATDRTQRAASRNPKEVSGLIDSSRYLAPSSDDGPWDSTSSMVGSADSQLGPGAAIQAALFAALGGPDPPPPGRRSSLQAKTGSKKAATTPPTKPPPPTTTTPTTATATATMSRPASAQPYSRNADFGMPSTVRNPPPQEQRKQYPPVSGPAGRGRLNIFRRSMSAAPTLSATDNVPMFSPPATDPISTPTRNLSIWGRRGSISEDDNRQRRNSILDSDFAEGASLASSCSGSGGSILSISTISASYKVPEVARPRSPLHISTTRAPPPPSATATPSSASRKKWLPFGRSNSLRNRAG